MGVLFEVRLFDHESVINLHDLGHVQSEEGLALKASVQVALRVVLGAGLETALALAGRIVHWQTAHGY